MFDLTSVILVIVMGLLHTGVAYLFYFASIKELPAAKVAIFGYVDPIVALLLSALVLREEMSVYGIIGAVLILAATLASELLPVFLTKKEIESRDGSDRSD